MTGTRTKASPGTPGNLTQFTVRRGDMTRLAGRQMPASCTVAGRTPEVRGVVLWIPDRDDLPILEIAVAGSGPVPLKRDGQAGELINDTNGPIVVRGG